MINTGIFSSCENLSLFVSNHPFKFQGNRPVCEYFMSFFNGMSKGQVDVMHNRASSVYQVARVTRYKFFSQNVPESSSITTEDKNIILKAYSTQKVGSGGNFESGNQVYGRR